jgi:hypothetical protein
MNMFLQMKDTQEICCSAPNDFRSSLIQNLTKKESNMICDSLKLG